MVVVVVVGAWSLRGNRIAIIDEINVGQAGPYIISVEMSVGPVG